LSKYKDEHRDIYKIAFTYVGTIIGAGFASGQEIMTFFSIYGKYSIFGIICASILFICVGTKMLIIGNRLKVRSFHEFINYVFGKLSTFVNAYMFFAFLVMGCAMLAGAGALFVEHNIPGGFWAGAFIMAIITMITAMFGMDGIITANSFIVPCIIIFNIGVFIYGVLNTHYQYSIDLLPDAKPLEVINSGILYASYNIIMSIGVIVSLGGKIDDRDSLKKGGILGGIIILVLISMLNYCVCINISEVKEMQIPILHIVNKMHPIFSTVYIFVVWSAIFTTCVGTLFSICSIVDKVIDIPWSINVISITGLLLYFSQFGLSLIVKLMYPLLGLIGYILIGLIIILS
jgi:uncharacterized membrane protein YkvI